MTVRPINNDNYKCLIYSADNGNVEAWLPEQFQLRVQSDWEPLLSNMLDTFGAGAVPQGQNMLFGKSFFVQSATGQVWRRTEPIEFNLELQFDAENSAKSDVTDKVKKLIEFSTPRLDSSGWFLEAPGPTLFNHTPKFSIRIGKYLWIQDVIFPSLDVTWYTAPDNEGQFIAADVQLQVRTFYTPTQQDILGWFGGVSSNSTINQESSESSSLFSTLLAIFGGVF